MRGLVEFPVVPWTRTTPPVVPYWLTKLLWSLNTDQTPRDKCLDTDQAPLSWTVDFSSPDFL